MDLSMSQGIYSIQQVADITGLTKQVIRKWEERHRIVVPQRLDNGYRVYSDQDIKTLLTVKALVEQGKSIKQASLLVNSTLPTKDFENRDHPSNPIQEYAEWNDYVLELIHEGAHCNEMGIHLLMQQALHHFGLDQFLNKVITPFLKEVGQRWETGHWDELQESIASLAVRDFLVQIRRNFKTTEDAPVVLGACLPHEWHELPVHLLLLQMMLKGWKTVLLGASPAQNSIPTMVNRLKPSIVLLSATTTIPFEKDPNLIQKLDELAAQHENIHFYLGGRGALEFVTGIELRSITVASSLEVVFRGVSK